MSIQSSPRRGEATDETLVGALLDGRYRLVRVLGRGGMGAVFEAVNERTDARLAVKVLHADQSLAADAHSRFDREARAPSRIGHPGIVQVLDAGYDERLRVRYLVQELLAGETLAQRLARVGRVPPREAFDVFDPVLDALSAAHRQGVVHRDIKPANIFMRQTPQGERPTLIDFGIAKVLSDEVGELTQEGAMMGSPRYMAPEQVRGELSQIGPATDVWAVGVVLRECLSGERVFAGRDVLSVVTRVVTENPPPLSTSLDAPWPALSAVIERAMQKDPAARFPSAESLRSALRDAVFASAPTALVAAPRRRAAWLAVPVALLAALLLVLLARSPRGAPHAAPPMVPAAASTARQAPSPATPTESARPAALAASTSAVPETVAPSRAAGPTQRAPRTTHAPRRRDPWSLRER